MKGWTILKRRRRTRKVKYGRVRKVEKHMVKKKDRGKERKR